ncbi:MOSC domain-containing protein [Pseudohongiella sp. O18]|uniref:MOSC domain-containing protein n=1 Tax=Pseudohongiella sp. O18 TaxID=2904248 RepID=UPI001F01DBFA|nr:MOSC domain-containing protein [Pseudohongiella sp. O18]
MRNSPLKVLIDTLPQVGRVEWIGLRPGRDAEMVPVARVHAAPDSGLEGDRYQGRKGGSGKRQVTLIQHEHLATIAALAHKPSVTAEMLRRNVVVSGINLLALKSKTFRIGEAILEYTGPCDPCSKMEALLGPGGYNAMRGHGGITARVLQEGHIAVGDELRSSTFKTPADNAT